MMRLVSMRASAIKIKPSNISTWHMKPIASGWLGYFAIGVFIASMAILSSKTW
jgi:hypothetical protein